MPNKFLADLWNRIGDHFLYDVIKTAAIAAGALVIAAATYIARKLLPGHDVLLAFIVFGVALVIFWACVRWLSRGQFPSSTQPIEVAPKLFIRSAFYGARPDAQRDVTEILQKNSRDALVVDISNRIFGDPAEGSLKHLTVEYSYGGGAILTVTRPENTLLILPEDSWLKAQLENALKSNDFAK